MCVGGTPAAPAPAARLPEAPQAPTAPTGAGGMSADERRRRAAAGQGRAGSILTGPRGIEGGGATKAKSLLGE